MKSCWEEDKERMIRREKARKTREKIRLNTREIHFIPNEALSLSNKRVKVFDEFGVMRIIPVAEAYERQISGIYRTEDGRFFLIRNGEMFGRWENNEVLFSKAVRLTQEGDSFKQFLDICKSVRFESRAIFTGYTLLDRFIGKIGKPQIERETDNLNPKTFDFVRIRVGLNDLGLEKKKMIQENYSEIMRRVLNALENNRSYKKYGVPVNFLRVTKITLTKSSELEILLELKTEIGEA